MMTALNSQSPEALMKTFRFGLAVLLVALAACSPKEDKPAAGKGAAPSTAGTSSTPETGSEIRGAKGPGPVKADEFNDRPAVTPKRGGEVTQAISAGFRSL